MHRHDETDCRRLACYLLDLVLRSFHVRTVRLQDRPHTSHSDRSALRCGVSERERELLRAQLHTASVHVKVVSGVVPDLAELGQPHAQVAREPLHQDLATVRVRARATVKARARVRARARVTAAQAPPWAHVRMTGLLHLAPLAVGPLELHDERGVG